MLAHLRIENLALIDALEVALQPGLNVLSGETGAGKSVLVDSLALLVGERAEVGAIRAGAVGAMVEGLFRLESDRLRRRVAELIGEPVEELSLRREIFRDQRNRCYVAGRLSPAGLLRELGEALLELHGQHEHQLLLRREIQRELLDAFGGLDAERSALARDLESWRAASRRLSEIRDRERARSERLRLLREELDEIASAGIDPEREAEHRTEADRLRNLEDRLARASRAAQALGGEEPSALDLLRSARPDLLTLARDEPRLSAAAARFEAAFTELTDLVRELERYLDGLAHDPARLAELDAREALLLRLTRRYGVPLEELLEREKTSRAEVVALEAEAGEGAGLEGRLADGERRLRSASFSLSQGRARSAEELAAAVRDNLRDLGLGRGDFEIRLERGEELRPGGMEQVEFMIAPNPGEPAAPLRAIASGGELSRVILALKAALARVDRVPTLVFDEIDVGIGGRVARRVAAKLVEIARRRQVIVITHLAQIAAPATLHLRVEKVVQGGRSLTRVAPLQGEERVEELSRMVGGEPGSESSRRYARELLHARGGVRGASEVRPVAERARTSRVRKTGGNRVGSPAERERG